MAQLIILSLVSIIALSYAYNRRCDCKYGLTEYSSLSAEDLPLVETCVVFPMRATLFCNIAKQTACVEYMDIIPVDEENTRTSNPYNNSEYVLCDYDCRTLPLCANDEILIMDFPIVVSIGHNAWQKPIRVSFGVETYNNHNKINKTAAQANPRRNGRFYIPYREPIYIQSETYPKWSPEPEPIDEETEEYTSTTVKPITTSSTTFPSFPVFIEPVPTPPEFIDPFDYETATPEETDTEPIDQSAILSAVHSENDTNAVDEENEPAVDLSIPDKTDLTIESTEAETTTESTTEKTTTTAELTTASSTTAEKTTESTTIESTTKSTTKRRKQVFVCADKLTEAPTPATTETPGEEAVQVIHVDGDRSIKIVIDDDSQLLWLIPGFMLLVCKYNHVSYPLYV